MSIFSELKSVLTPSRTPSDRAPDREAAGAKGDQPAKGSSTATEPSVAETSTSGGADIFIARQPIFDRKMEVQGYELLYRGGNVDSAQVTCDATATQSTLMNSLVEIGLNDLVGKHLAYVNLGPDYIFGGFPFTEYKDRLVLEVLETIPIDQKLIRAVRKLKDLGFKIALDDVAERPEVELLYPIADIVKIDISLVPAKELAGQIALIRKHKHLVALAEKIEDPHVHRRCFELGFDLFQGYFFERPTIVKGTRLSESRMTVLQLIAKLQNPMVSVIEIDALIKQDASLSYKILRYINSAMAGVAKEITSVRQAITLLGLDRIRVLATLLGLAANSKKPVELLVSALVRARSCELVAQQLKSRDPSAFFVVGLFSLLDAMLDQPLSAILRDLPLSDEIRRALIDREGLMGRVLTKVHQFERGDWNDSTADDLPREKIRGSYLEAIRWTAGWQPELFFKQ